MAQAHILTVHVEGPEGGGIRMQLRSEREEVVVWLSAIGGDGIAELVRALLVVLGGADMELVWYEVPGELEGRFQRSDDRVCFTLYRRQVLHSGERVLREELRAEGLLRTIVRPFWKALRDLQTRFSAEEYARRWVYVFPAREVEALGLALTRRGA